MNNICKNCGKIIRVSIFRGGDWCSENCRKALFAKEQVQKASTKCSYEPMYSEEMGPLDVCMVHGSASKYDSIRGEHRPCLAVEPY